MRLNVTTQNHCENRCCFFSQWSGPQFQDRTMLTTALIEKILASIPNRTIGVLGDLFLDRYLDLDAALTEPSIETRLDAYQVVTVRPYPVAPGTVINNLAALAVAHIL